MKKLSKQTFASVLCSALLLISPAAAVAEPETIIEEQTLAPVLITEIQTGNAARADEFIELYNATEEPLDLTGWQLRYITASATSLKNVEDPSTTITLTPPVAADGAELVPVGGYYVLYSGAVALPAGVVGQQYEGLVPATGGSLVLVGPDEQTCEFVVYNAVAWGATTHLFGEGEALVAGSASANDRLFQRFVENEGAYSDTASNAQDFLATVAATATPTAGGVNDVPVPEPLPVGSGVQSQAIPERFSNPDCQLTPEPEPPTGPTEPTAPPEESPPAVIEPSAPEPNDDEPELQPAIPAGNSGLKAPIISELLPNPASPQTDRNDEFIELYNPNDSAFDLSRYVLSVGLTTQRRFTIPAGTTMLPRAFLAFFSGDSNLALSNTGSRVSLVDPLGNILVTSEAYASAKDGQAWVLANGTWQWTTKPTPNALNVVSAPAVKTSTAKNKKTNSATTTRASATNSKSTAPQPEEDVQDSAAVAATTSTPLHPGVLAAIAVSALLYGAYEYRHDVANRLYQFRTNRAARRAARQSPEGR